MSKIYDQISGYTDDVKMYRNLCFNGWKMDDGFRADHKGRVSVLLKLALIFAAD